MFISITYFYSYILNYHFINLGLLEIAGKSDSKITFDNFLEFITNEH